MGDKMQKPEEKKIYSRLFLIVFILAVALVLYLGTTNSADSKDAPRNDEVMTLNVVPLKPQNAVYTKQYIGYVTPINSVDVLPYISGFLQDVYVVGGQEVKTGDKLVVIKQDEYKAQMDLTLANVMQAEANYNNAKIYYDRLKKVGVKAVSKTELDNAKANFLSTQAQVAQAKANYKIAKVNYEYTMINSTINGVVGNVDLTKGDYVSPSSSMLLKIIQYNPIRVVFSITDKDYLDEMANNHKDLFVDEKIQIKLSNGEIYPQIGEFKYADNEINKNTNSIAVYADFPNEKKDLVANAYVDVILEKNYPNGIIIKQSLVDMQSDGNYIYVVSDGKLSKRKITIIGPINSDYLIKNEFNDGDYIVLDKVGRIDKDKKIKMHVVDETKEPK